MFWIVSQFASVIQELILGLLILCVDALSEFLGGFSLKLLEESLTFNGVNYYELLYTYAIMPIAIGFLIANISWHLYKTMFTSDEQGAEDPVKVILRSGLAMVLIFYIDEIVSLVQKAFEEAKNLIENLTKFDNVWEFSGVDLNDIIPSAGDDLLNESLSALSIFANIDLIFIVGMIIIDLFLLVEFLKVISMFIQRYIYMGFSVFMLPLPMAALPCDSTKPITQTYMKSLISSFVSYLLSRIYLFFFVLVLAQAMVWDSKATIFANIFQIFLAKGIGEFFLQFDAFLDKVGLTNANRYRPSNMLDMALGRWIGSEASSIIGTTGLLGGGKGGFGGGGGFSLVPDGKGGFTATPLPATGAGGSGMFGALAKGVSMTHMPMNMTASALGDGMKNAANNFAAAEALDAFKNASNGLEGSSMLDTLESGDNLKNALNNEFAGGPLSDQQLADLNDNLSNAINGSTDGFGYEASLGGDDSGYEDFNSTLQGMFENEDAVVGSVDGNTATFTPDGNGGFDATFADGSSINGADINGNAMIGVEDNDFPKDIHIEGINGNKNGNELYGTISMGDYDSRATIRECSAAEVHRNTDSFYKSYNTTSGMRYLEVTPGNIVSLQEDGSAKIVNFAEKKVDMGFLS